MKIKTLIAAGAVAVMSVASSAHAAVIDLGFAIDESGSVSGLPSQTTTELGLIREGLARALDLIPSVGATGNPNTYTVTVVQFASSAQTLVSKTVIDDTTRAAIQNTLRTAPRIGGGTNIPGAVNALTNAVCGSGTDTCSADTTLFNVATDGQGGDPNFGGANSANSIAQLAGVDGISYEVIGNFGSSITSFAFPGTPVYVTDAADLPNPTQTGFVFGVNSFLDFEDAIAGKVGRVVIDTGGGGTNVIPLPAAAWMLIAGVGALGFVGRRRQAAA